MKNMIIAVSTIACLSCLIGCSDKPPSVQVANQRTTKANVQFKQANGNTINHNDVATGAMTVLQDVAEGQIVVKAEIQSESVSPTIAFNASKDNNYTVVILGGDPPTLRVDTQGK